MNSFCIQQYVNSLSQFCSKGNLTFPLKVWCKVQYPYSKVFMAEILGDNWPVRADARNSWLVMSKWNGGGEWPATPAAKSRMFPLHLHFKAFLWTRKKEICLSGVPRKLFFYPVENIAFFIPGQSINPITCGMCMESAHFFCHCFLNLFWHAVFWRPE